MKEFPNPGLHPFESRAGMDGIEGRYVRVTAVQLAPRKNDFIFALAELQVFDEADTNLSLGKPVAALDSIEAPPRWRKTNLTDGVAPEAPSEDERQKILDEREDLILSLADEPAKRQRAARRGEEREIEQALKSLPAPSTVYAGTVFTGTGNFRGTGAEGGRPRPISVLARGDVTKPGEPGALSAVPDLNARFALANNAPGGERRAALARWITEPHNPLTWRSIVNRVWQYHFGRGLVDTPNDSGRMGQLPSHPELLDWLAAEFRDSGGSFKKLHRLIVTSATYRQSVAPNERATAIDAGNALLWRQNRRKLEAEAIRDSLLSVAGKLDLTMGGPSFQDFTIEKPQNSPHYRYELADPEDPKLHRRSVYCFLVRSQQQPFMAALDCADPSMLFEKRIRSYELAARMQLAAPEALDVSKEPAHILRLYGLEKGPRTYPKEINAEEETEYFSRKCLVARRLLERGVRFVQVWSGCDNGFPRRNWDSHEDVARDHGPLARALAVGASALIQDLKQRGMLDDTIVLWTTEFGRMPSTQGGKGRDHNPHCFTNWLCGGGIRSGVVCGESDEWGYKPRDRKNATEVYGIHATILRLLGIDHERLTFRHNGIDRRLTDVHGHVIAGLLA